MGITANREIYITTSDGQRIVLTEKDKVESTTTHVVVCDGPRCAARHETDKPREFTFDLEKVEKDQRAFPPEADEFLSIMLPARSPSNSGAAVPLCSIQCVKDYLTYVYIAPGPRQPESEKPITAEAATTVQKTELSVNEPVPQADGDPGDVHGV